MPLLRKLRALHNGELRLLLQAFCTVAAVRLALWLLPFRRVEAFANARPFGTARHSVQRIVWSIGAAARRIPRASCLTQSLAAMTLLAANHHTAEIRYGVARDGERLRAHSWVEVEGRIVIGDPGDQPFVPLVRSGAGHLPS